MPHDASGQPILVGDLVTMRFRVAGVSQGNTACNVVLETIDEAATGEYLPTVSCNSRLATKAGSAVPELAHAGPS